MLKIGWSKKDISSNDHLILAGQGYVRFSKFVLDPIYATALTVDDGKDYVIFLSVDIVSIRNHILKDIREKVKATNPEIDPEKILMNATHTHSGPVVCPGDDMGSYGKFSELPHDGVDLVEPAEYYKFFISQCAEAVCESFAARSEGYISYGYGFATTSHNRRAVYFKDMTEGSTDPTAKFIEGTTKMYGTTAIPEFSGLESGADPYVNFMFTFGKDGKLTGAVLNVPSPSQNMELEYSISADFWADVREEIAKRYGDIYILPQCAAAGDLAPRARYYDKAEERRFRLKYADVKLHDGLVNPPEIFRRKDICEQIVNAFEDVYSWAQKEKFDDIPIVHSVKTIQLNKRFITDEEYEAFKNKPKYVAKPLVCTDDKVDDLKWNSREISHRIDKNVVVERYETQKAEPTIAMEMHVIRVGNIAFASNMFELYMDFAHRIQGRSPFEQTFIVQLCAQPHRGAASYLATELAAKGRGYSANLFSNLVSPEGGQQLVEATLEELNKLYD